MVSARTNSVNKIALTSMFVLVVSGVASAAPPSQRVPVNVMLVGDDGLTQGLEASLEAGLRSHPNLRLAADKEPRLTISSRTNVGWDNLGGREVVIYTVFIGPGLLADEPITGICYQTAMSKCARDILRIASTRSRGRPFN